MLIEENQQGDIFEETGIVEDTPGDLMLKELTNSTQMRFKLQLLTTLGRM